jgi:hypothetical protein
VKELRGFDGSPPQPRLRGWLGRGTRQEARLAGEVLALDADGAFAVLVGMDWLAMFALTLDGQGACFIWTGDSWGGE